MTANERGWTGGDAGGSRLSTWLVVAGFSVVLVLVAVALRTPAPAGYERSIYGAYPWFFWVLVVLALFIGQAVVLRAALARYPETEPWRLGVLLVVVVEALLVFMPYVRGYPLYGAADVLTHVGYVEVIDRTGGGMHVNVYQNIHQLVLALSYATGVEPMHVINAVAGVVSLFLVVASFALLSAVFDRRRTLMTLPFVVVLLGGRAHLNPSPFAQSVLMVPFVLYLFVRTQQTESLAYRLALTVSVVGLITYHPMTGLFLILVFVVHYAVVFATQGPDERPSVQVSPVSSKLVMQLSLVTFVAWYYNFVGIFIRFEHVIEQILGRSTGESELARYSSALAQYSPSPADLAVIGLVNHGQTAVYLAIGVAFGAVKTWLYLKRKRVGTPYLLTFGLGFGLFVALGVVFLTVNLIGGFGRPLVFAQLFAAFVAGSLLYDAYVLFDWRTGVTTVASVALVALVVFSVVGLYYSPMTGESNHQVTRQNVDGARWYLDNGRETVPLRQVGISMSRFEDALYGTDSWTLPAERGGVPDHFNYPARDTLGGSYNETQYLVVTERGRVFYPTTYPDYRQFWGFVPADWARLERDPTVSHVYGNGEFDLYVVEPANESGPTGGSGPAALP